MILRKANGQFYLEVRSDEALNIITQLSQALEVGQKHRFPQTAVFSATHTEGYTSQHYPNTLSVRVDPLP